MFSAFDPDLKIAKVEGKTFDKNTPEIERMKKLQGVASFAEVVEETALISYNNRQMPAKILGVDAGFEKVTSIDSLMYDGKFLLNDGNFNRSVVGIGVANDLGINTNDIHSLEIRAPKRIGRINIVRPENSFNTGETFVSGIFVVNQPEYDDQFVIIPIQFARQLFEYDENTVSYLELKIAQNADLKKVQKETKELLGKDFKVQNKYEQQEDFFKITKMEKWMTYLILCFILLIATFNIIGSLSMLILEKKDDIQTLRSLGATDRVIKTIFLFEGWLISILGALAGICLGIGIVLIQQKFGILKLGGENYVVDAYPVVLVATDIVITLVSVMVMGFLASIYPIKYISTKNVLE